MHSSLKSTGMYLVLVAWILCAPSGFCFQQGFYYRLRMPNEFKAIQVTLSSANHVLSFSKEGKITLYSKRPNGAVPEVLNDLTELKIKKLLKTDSKNFICVIFDNQSEETHCKSAFDPRVIAKVRRHMHTKLAFIDSLHYQRALLLTPGHSNTLTGWYVLEDRKQLRSQKL